jgi:hypothetical protein
MHLISHRGYWVNENEKNKINAFHRAFKFGFGAEIDLREYKGELLVSHDLLCGEELNFDQILSIWDGESKLALNIKEDGLASIIQSKMKPFAPENWFVFDMSIPDTLNHIKIGNPVFIRMSEIEKDVSLLKDSRGVWLDAFQDIWYDLAFMEEILSKDRKICIVSPELHDHDYKILWSQVKTFQANDNILLCTDFPNEAKSFFERHIND